MPIKSNDAIDHPHSWRRFLVIMASELRPDEYGNLLTPTRHSPLLTSKRAVMIINRARFIALLFALLTPLWCIVDYVVFPSELWRPMIFIRLLVSITFLGLVLYYKSSTHLRHAYRAMCLLFLIPCVFYVLSRHLLMPFTLSGIPSAIASGYTFLPFVLIAVLSIFPLSVLENLILVGIILVTQLASILFHPDSQSWMGLFGTFWLLLLLTGISTLAGCSQLAFIVALVRQAVRDPLTACFTRRSGEELLNLQFSISCRSKAPLSLAFVDLDHFKSVNDQFGHEAGDLILQQAATSIRQMLRAGDMLVRWGGEEFLIIMPNTDIHQADMALARLCLSGLGKRPDGKAITASAGIAERMQDEVANQHDLINLSDHRMYLAKEQGRNRVIREG
jgi:diguanylate cyclase (GGDEF)-like protein